MNSLAAPPNMAFKHGLSERLDELRFPSPRSPPSDSTFPGYSPLSPGTSNFTGFSRPITDVRANLQRRFTTDSSKLSSWSYLSQGASQEHDPLDMLSSVQQKRKQIELMREQRRRFEQDMRLLDQEQQKESTEMEQLCRRLAQAGVPSGGLSGPASEPTTPPEYAVHKRDVFDNYNSNNVASVTSSPGFFSAFAPSSTLTSPQAPSHQGHYHAQSVDRFTGFSLPGSRRNSEMQDSVIDTSAGLRSGQSVHRASLPSNNLTGKFRTNPLAPYGSYALDSFAPKSIFDDYKPVMKDEDRMSTPDIKGYINMTEPDDKFPTSSHVRRDSDILSANHDALRIDNGRTPGPDHFNPQSRRTRSTHQSMPQNLGPARFDNVDESYDRIMPRHQAHQQPHHQPHRSLESSFNFPIEHSGSMTPVGRPVSLQSSYSTNDVPTMSAMGYDSAITPPHTRSGSFHQHNASMGHQHNASMGRIPGNASQPHSSRNSPESVNGNHQAGQNMLQPSALVYGSQQYAQVSGNSAIPGVISHANAQYQPYPNPFATTASYGQSGQQIAYGPPVAYQQNHASFQPASYQAAPRVGPTPRRGVDGADSPHQNRYNNTPIEQHIGQIYALCKDQFGCRYLQRKLEERDPSVLKIIFNETCAHVNELMIDPFGNYLCQKLLEFSNNDQRTLLINNAASQLVEIALNQHGTRALQKMIEYISTQEQIRTVIYALRDSVVELVQDLNGNHVIQKCLTRLKGENAEFIYEAVGNFCVKVGTHRHGCCVIQRCIDHASDEQKKRLIARITSNSIALVQDPYGNYVVQYILDLGETYFTTRMCYTFDGKIALLSKQKFSSNVMEKCLRMADPIVRNDMIQEMFKNNEIEKMLRDSFANYVVQTAMEYAEENTRTRLHAAIREKLPLIRNTPHGRRIATKLTAFENAHAAMNHRNLAYQAEMANALQATGTQVHAGAPTTACYQAVTPPAGESSSEGSSNSTGVSEQSQGRLDNFTPRRDRSPSPPVNAEGISQISNQLDRFHIPSFAAQDGPSDGYSVEQSPQGGQNHL